MRTIKMAMMRFATAVAGITVLTGCGRVLADPEIPGTDENICTDGKYLNLALPLGQEILTFKCGPKITTLDPSDPLLVYTENSSPGQGVPLNTVMPGATFQHGQGGSSHTLRVPNSSRPPKETYILYLCKEAGAAGENGPVEANDLSSAAPRRMCLVDIKVAAKSPEGETENGTSPPQGQEDTLPPDVNTCNAGQDKELTVSEPGELKLKCSAGLSFQPEETSAVFDDGDGKCETVQSLTTLVPAAVRSDQKGIVTVGIPRLPSTGNKAICYQCTSGEADNSDTRESSRTETSCKFRITVLSSTSADPESNGDGPIFRGSKSMAAAFFSVVAALATGVMALAF
ncbi:srs domain-containing protein [Neospora caninum Liverpool]|uniref:Srs domain-containing protein n=1 Tax=Neospora caninum (strain Liverpool) TaxID=572307 RepID=F0VCH2_NEOCL|nr:srs domain-containing protein [Neospora caninum Liverpool]CBZ51294.1 srs domain-containing protein [Neospora caninum Liverpool]CEL68608.1 TPA: SRS domain-containing protein [Neospora caninum Liverpool]|eukprot:XP_003881327.1 srs domain-containing protein [Neospora caninum Liverpool]